MRKWQSWFSAWLSILLTLLVAIGGVRGEVFHTAEVYAASGLEAGTDYAERVAASLVAETYKHGLGAGAEALREEDRQAYEMKQAIRESEARQQDMQHYLLASRSVHLARYAQLEKAKLGQKVAQQAVKFVGTPYVWGGTNPQGFDCSGFTQYIYSQNGVAVPRNSYDQYQVGKEIHKNELQPGDLVFFTTYAPGPSHLGIYIGDGKFVHALNRETGVTTSTLDADYYRDRFLGAKRVL
jgi:cell wall-associated NlpC family hydrolase